MIRTVAAVFAAFALIGLDAFAQGSAESTKQTETKSDSTSESSTSKSDSKPSTSSGGDGTKVA